MSDRQINRGLTVDLSGAVIAGAVAAIAIGAVVFAEYLAGRDPLRCYERQRSAQPAAYSQTPAAVATYQAPNCAVPQDDKQDDLCPQRRMAEAAEESACIARWQFWISMFGLGGLIATVVYAAQNARAATSAAIASAESAEVAEKSLAATQRPWVSVKLEIASDLKFRNNEGVIECVLHLSNTGLSPAANIEIRAKLCAPASVRRVIEEMSQEARQKAAARRQVPLGRMVGFSLFPKDSTEIEIRPRLNREDSATSSPRACRSATRLRSTSGVSASAHNTR